MNFNSESTIKPSHHHIITRSLLTMDLYDGIIGKITNTRMILEFCDDFDIIFVKTWENSILYWKILSIISEHFYPSKALLPDVLPKSDYLPIYAPFQLYPAFLDKKTPQKQAVATLKNSKTQASSSGYTNTPRHTHKGSSPLYAITKANTFSVYALQRYEGNPGQITMNIKIRTIHEWQYHKPGLYVFTGGGFIVRILS